ncbi:hypothetical protein V5O48_013259 [Marasmius crinis-equi]|uniref:AAA+ ATPase domain-containing protein n=1 Tax=Marasmius crinis-equi TaxID=585013 RepID=A0ABR3F0Q4_9AGAR
MNIFRRISRAVRGSSKDDNDNHWGNEPKFPLPPQPHGQRTPTPPPHDGWGANPGPSSHYHDHSGVSSKDHYAQCAEIWDRDQNRWFLFDPKDIPPVHESLAWFCVTASSYGHWVESEVWVQPNEIEMGQALRTLEQSKTKLDEIRERNKMNREEKLALIRSLGNIAVDSRTSEAEMDTYLDDMEKQLQVFVSYLETKFKPIAERLANAIQYGYLEFDLLPYYFKPGQEVWFTPPGEEPLAMKVAEVEVRIVLLRNRGNGWGVASDEISVKGHGYYWDGNCFAIRPLKMVCNVFIGRKEITTLPIQLMTPKKREELIVRGRRYKAEAGINYRIWQGERVVIDHIGYFEAFPGLASGDPPTVQGTPLLENTTGSQIADDLLCFLPAELFGYHLRKKEWWCFALGEVKPVEFDGRAWEHLVLDKDVKTLIKGLVEVSTKTTAASGALVNDVIARKGGGLTSVLYGPPGTGKTLTAEAVAELLKRPLLTVGSADLPREPSKMEEALRYILQLATSWDAVLLIDEADVFLEQRSLHEIERNALVSVALRVLEYHHGVVFLTTNRIKVFDDAFLSRFSIAVKYPEINPEGRYLIWSRFLELAGYKIVESPFVTNDDLNHEKTIPRKSIEALAAKSFNGRTIKNLFRTAQALALSTNSPLKMEHVHIVVRTQEKFLEDFAVERGSLE